MVNDINFRETLREKSIEYLKKANKEGGFESLIDVAVGIALGEVVRSLDKASRKEITTGFPL